MQRRQDPVRVRERGRRPPRARRGRRRRSHGRNRSRPGGCAGTVDEPAAFRLRQADHRAMRAARHRLRVGALDRRASPSTRLRAVRLRRPILDSARPGDGRAVSVRASGVDERIRVRPYREADRAVRGPGRRRLRRRARLHAGAGARYRGGAEAGARGRSPQRQHRRRAGRRASPHAVRADGVRAGPASVSAHPEPVRAVRRVRRRRPGGRRAERGRRKGGAWKTR